MPEISSIDGVKIFYEVIGTGDVSLVLIGGWGASTGRECWKYQLPLASNYRIVLIDLVGHGKSGINREKYTMELFGHDIKAVIEELDLKEIILIGWSMGGSVILETELLISDRIIGLIPVDSLFPTLGSLYTKMEEETIPIVIKPFEENFSEAFTNLLNSFITDKIDPKDIETLQTGSKLLDKRSMLSAFRELLKWNVHEILPKVGKPLKSIIAGKTIENYSREEYDRFFDTIYLENLGHLMPYEDPTRFNLVLEERIKDLMT